MNIIKFTQKGYDAFVQRLSEKQAELLKVQKERSEALQNTTESDMNDPELVTLQQAETSLRAMVAKLEGDLVRATVVTVTDYNRNTNSVQIGSIIEIQKINSTTGEEHQKEIWEIAGYDETDVKQRMLAYNSPLASPLIDAVLDEYVPDVVISGQTYDIHIAQLFKSWTDV